MSNYQYLLPVWAVTFLEDPLECSADQAGLCLEFLDEVIGFRPVSYPSVLVEYFGEEHFDIDEIEGEYQLCQAVSIRFMSPPVPLA